MTFRLALILAMLAGLAAAPAGETRMCAAPPSPTICHACCGVADRGCCAVSDAPQQPAPASPRVTTAATEVAILPPRFQVICAAPDLAAGTLKVAREEAARRPVARVVERTCIRLI